MDDQTAAYFEQNAETVATQWEKSRGAERYFGVAFPVGSRVLDIGSGTGRDLAFLLRNGWDAFGLEPSLALRDLSVRLHPEILGRVSSGTLPTDVPENGEFDGVLCSAVLQHLPKSQFFDAVYTVKKLLRNHGRVLVTVSEDRPGLDDQYRDEHGRLFTPVVPDVLALLALPPAAAMHRRKGCKASSHTPSNENDCNATSSH